MMRMTISESADDQDLQQERVEEQTSQPSVMPDQMQSTKAVNTTASQPLKQEVLVTLLDAKYGNDYQPPPVVPLATAVAQPDPAVSNCNTIPFVAPVLSPKTNVKNDTPEFDSNKP